MTPLDPLAAPSGGLPLDGITVVSLEQAVAAPYATRQLADLGARVIKVERPGGGDFARNYDSTVKGLASYFVWLNRGKESVALDLKSAGGLSALTALYARVQTGDGAALSVSLFESLAEWMSQPMYYAMYAGTPPPRTGTSHATIAPYGTFRTAGGGSVQLAVQNDREWRRLCEQVLGRPRLADDHRFATNTARVANRAGLHAEIEAALAAYPTEKVLELLDAAQIANGRMNSVVDLLDHPQLAHRWAEVDSPAGPLRALPSPISLARGRNSAAPALGAIPAVGEHTAAVLAEFGLSDTEIAEISALNDAGAAR
ncbi:MAG: itaconate CoA-transferase [Trebonia sp.]|nr:itaconate CoA-transferase [Trebonia sp.]